MKLNTRVTHGPSPVAPFPCVVLDLPAATAETLLPPDGVARLAERSRDVHHFLPDYAATSGAPDLASRLDFIAAWVLEALNFARGQIEGAGAQLSGDHARLFCGYHDADLTRRTFDLAFRLAAAPDAATLAPLLDDSIPRLWRACHALHPDYQTAFLIEAARAMDVPAMPYLPGEPYWQYGQGARARVFRETLPQEEGTLADQISQNKLASKKLMRSVGLPVCDHLVVTSADGLAALGDKVPYPCVLKPLDRGLGRGLTANIQTQAHLEKAYAFAQQSSQGRVMIEPYVTGQDFRLGVQDGRFLYAVERTRQEVTGDGVQSIRQMIDTLNIGLTRNVKRSGYKAPIEVNETLEWQLERQGVTPDTVLEPGRVVRLTENGGLGGDYIEVTDKVHPDLIAMVEECAAALHYRILGFDYRTTDITKPPGWGGGAFLEYNATVGIVVLIRAGRSVEQVARVILGDGRPDAPGRIETLLCIVDDPAQAMAEAPSPGPGKVLCTRKHLRTARRMIAADSAHPWAPVLQALRRPDSERLTIFATARDVTRHGFPLDKFTRIEMADDALPAPWKALAQRISGAVSGATGAATAAG